MDVNEYMSKSLALLERIAEGVEAINESGVFIANQNDLENAIPVVVLGGAVSNVETVVTAGGGKKPEPAKQDAKPAPAKQEAKPAPAAGQEKPKDEPAKPAGKKVTVDDARAALKAYAAIEGNDAAMEMLTSLGAASVSALAEQGPEKLQELIDKCGGK